LLLNVRRHAELPHCQRYGPHTLQASMRRTPYT